MPKANYFRVLRPLLEPSGIAADDRLFAQNDARSRPDSNINHYSFVLGSAGKHVQSASINVFYSTPPPPPLDIKKSYWEDRRLEIGSKWLKYW